MLYVILASLCVLIQSRNVPIPHYQFEYPVPNSNQELQYWNRELPTNDEFSYAEGMNMGPDNYELNVDHQKYIPTIDGKPIYIPPVIKFDKNRKVSSAMYPKETRPWHYWQDMPLPNYGYANEKVNEPQFIPEYVDKFPKTKENFEDEGSSDYYVDEDPNIMINYPHKHGIRNKIKSDIDYNRAFNNKVGEILPDDSRESPMYNNKNSMKELYPENEKSKKEKDQMLHGNKPSESQWNYSNKDKISKSKENESVNYGHGIQLHKENDKWKNNYNEQNFKNKVENKDNEYKEKEKDFGDHDKTEKPKDKHKGNENDYKGDGKFKKPEDQKHKGNEIDYKGNSKAEKPKAEKDNKWNKNDSGHKDKQKIPKEETEKYISNKPENTKHLESNKQKETKEKEDEYTGKQTSPDSHFDIDWSRDDSGESNIDLEQESAKKKFLDTLDTKFRSLVFNPSAQPHEKFQNCLTPTNETGSCRYVQHCLLPNILSAIDQFMNYVCIIEDRFVGVCCPEHPVTLIRVKWDDLDPLNSENTTVKTPEECGASSRTRIVGGEKANPKDYPWMAALQTQSTGQFFCGGSLINDRYVLTAAHCTFGIPRDQILVRLGEYDFSDTEGSLGEDFPVVEIKRHGQYSKRTLENDIALLKLGKPVTFAKHIKTICLPDNRTFDGEINATLAGWGNTKGGGPSSKILQEATFPVVTNKKCEDTHGLPVSKKAVCTLSTPHDKGACNGDSGGPLMVLDEDTKHWYVIGVVSWGRRGCDPKFPTVYAGVSNYMDWIKTHAV